MSGKIAEQTFSVQETGKLIGFPGGEIQFFDWLRRKGFLLQNNQPAQSFINRGWFKLVPIQKRITGHLSVIPVTRVTIKGLYGLIRVVKKAFPICKPCSDGK